MEGRADQSSQAYDQLRRLLIHGQVRPGVRLPELEWCDRLGVHRDALRQALSVLAHEGLLRRGENGGFFSPDLSQQDLDDVLEVRAILEIGAIRRLCARPSTATVKTALLAVCDQMRQLLDAELELGFVEADRLFHLTVIRHAGNDRLAQIYERAPLPLNPSREPDAAVRRANAKTTIEEHRKIAQFIGKRDAAAAVELLENHLLRAHRLAPVY